jgi:hypothetical protein
MVEELGSILRNGFDTWKKNLTICLPFVKFFKNKNYLVTNGYGA